MMTRTIVCLFAACLIAQSQTPGPGGTYRFTTPEPPQGLEEVSTILRTVAVVSQVSLDNASAVYKFTGPSDAVDFAEWLLPQIDKAAGDNTVHEYKLQSGDVGRVVFLANATKPQDVQEVLTVLRTVADVSKIFTLTSNHAIAMRGPAWSIDFAQWIVQQLDQSSVPSSHIPAAFTVGGPDFRGLGHSARVNFLANITSPQQTQELLTILRTVDDLQKVFNYTSRHAFTMRDNDTDLQRAEWIIQQLDLPAGSTPGGGTFSVSAADDVTTIFHVSGATQQWLHTAMTAMRNDLNIKHVFQMTAAASLVVRGTADQIAAANAWMASHAPAF